MDKSYSYHLWALSSWSLGWTVESAELNSIHVKIHKLAKMSAKSFGTSWRSIKSIITGEWKTYMKNGINETCIVYQDILEFFGSKIGELSL